MTVVVMARLTRRQKYRLVTGSVMPRPIALVTTLNADGSCNAAPFSAFNYMCDDPPVAALGVERYWEESPARPGEMKDTLRNVIERNAFVINMVDEGLLDAAEACAAEMPAHQSETTTLGLDLAPSQTVDVPRLAKASIAWECTKLSITPVGPARDILLGTICAMYFRPGLLDEAAMKVDVDQYFAVGRLGNAMYVRTHDRLRLP